MNTAQKLRTIADSMGLDGYAESLREIANDLEQAPAPASTQDEPFGYFRPDAFGWTDCAADEEGAIALYERPAAPAVPQGWTDADSDAARLALELECLLLDTETLSVVSKWWASANEALELHRQRLATLAAPSQPAVPQGEPWYGHKFKEVTRGVWHCECGETVNEGATPCTNGTQSISTMRRDAVNVDATEMHDAGSAAHAGQGKFTRVDGSRSSLRGSGTQDDPFVADNLDDLAAAPTSPLQEPVTDDVPAHVEGLLEHRRELDAIEFFESTNRDSHGFRRSVRGTYVNPAVARDWKWFQLGMQHATKE